jgi:carbonic anhydrase
MNLDSIVASVKEDIALLQNSPLISRSTQILGFTLDLKSGQLTEVKLDGSKV